MKIRIDKLITDTGICTRSDAKELIRRGLVVVNGAPVTRPEEKVSEEAAITVDGKPLHTSRFHYLMMDKPEGVVCATEDREQKTVLDLLPVEYRRMGIFPVGRLDIDTTGLLLLTNDGDFAHRVISPRSGTMKVYLAETEKPVTDADIQAFREGVLLKDGTVCLPALLTALSGCRALVTVSEGKYHQVKRMLASRGAYVKKLRRLSIGEVKLDETLGSGGFRELEQWELLTLSGINTADQ